MKKLILFSLFILLTIHFEYMVLNDKNEIYEEYTNTLALADKFDDAINISDEYYHNNGNVEAILEI